MVNDIGADSTVIAFYMLLYIVFYIALGDVSGLVAAHAQNKGNPDS